MRKKLQEALDEIDRKKGEIENVNIKIEEVKKESELGKLIIKMQLEYLKSMKKGF